MLFLVHVLVHQGNSAAGSWVCVLCEPPARLCQPLANCGLVTRTRAVGHGAGESVCVCVRTL